MSIWYSGTSLLRPPTGLGKGDLSGEITVLHGPNLLYFCTVEYNLGQCEGNRNGEVTSEVTLRRGPTVFTVAVNDTKRLFMSASRISSVVQ